MSLQEEERRYQGEGRKVAASGLTWVGDFPRLLNQERQNRAVVELVVYGWIVGVGEFWRAMVLGELVAV